MKNIKRFIFVLLVAVMIVSPLTNVDAKSKKTTTAETTTKATTTTTKKAKKEEKVYDKIKVYVFYGDGCPHCAELHEYLDDLAKNKEVKGKFEVVDYEVWYNEKNSTFLKKVGDHFKHEVKGVPFYVIGDQTFDGFAEEAKSTIKETILEFYGNDSYKDVVSTLGSGESDAGNTTEEKTDSKLNNVVGIIILAVVAGFIIVMIVLGAKNKDEEDDDEEEVEVVVEEPKKVEVKEETKKAEVKKAPAKKASTTKAPAKKTAAKKSTAKKSTSKKSK